MSSRSPRFATNTGTDRSAHRGNMTDQFFKHPILNSPYAYPARHWELDSDGQPTDHITENRRRSDLITPVPKPKKRRQGPGQTQMVFDAGDGLSSGEQKYNPTPIINEVRTYVETWRALPNPDQWLVTPETARLLKHWRSQNIEGIMACCRFGGHPVRVTRLFVRTQPG